MSKKMAKKQSSVQVALVQESVIKQEVENSLFDFTDPDEFRRAFIASEILNRKY